MNHSQAQRRAQTVTATDEVLNNSPVSDHHVAMSYLIDAHVAHMRAEGLSERTVGAREELLRRLHNHLPYGLGFAATAELDQWLGRPGWSKWTRATYAMHIRAFYRWATGVGHQLDGDPAADMAKPRNPKCLPDPVTDDELDQALTQSAEPWYTAILIAAYAGLRVSEIARLDRTDITEDVMRLIGKGGNRELVDTHPIVWKHIKDRPPGPLIVSPNGAPVSGKWLSAHARHHFDAIGLPAVHMHRFRHWFATTLLNTGASMRAVQDALRHESVTSTQIYTKVRNGQRRLAIRSLPTPDTRRPAEH